MSEYCEVCEGLCCGNHPVCDLCSSPIPEGEEDTGAIKDMTICGKCADPS